MFCPCPDTYKIHNIKQKKIDIYFCSLLFQDFTAKLSDFGLAIDGPQGDETHVSASVMGTQGYAAPEYINTGNNIKHVIVIFSTDGSWKLFVSNKTDQLSGL